MTTPTSNLGLLKGVGSDNWRTYLKTNLASSLDVLDKAIGQIANVKGYGAVGDGSTDDRTAILAAETALGANGGTLYFPAGTYRTASDMTLLPTTNVAFPGGATLAPATSTVVTIAGTVHAGLHQIFAVGAGTIAFTRIQPIYPEWWGATTYVKTRSSDGAITNGTATFTTSGAIPFAATDVGKICVVLGAGASGAPLVTTISAYNSTTSVTLAANASTTVSTARWAVGTDQSANVQACLDASAGCPVLLSSLYGVASIKLRQLQILRGLGSTEQTGFVRLASDANPAVSLHATASGDSMRLSDFCVNAMFFGALDGIEIGTSSAALALANAFMTNVLVRNAGGWAFNLRVNGLTADNLISKHDGAPVSTNTTAGAFRFIDTLVYANVLGCTGYYPAGTHLLAAGGGSTYTGLEAESGGTYATMDMVTISAYGVRVRGVYITNPGTCRDLIKIPTGSANHEITGIFVGTGATFTNVVNDVDRSYTMVNPAGSGSTLGSDVSIPYYRNFGAQAGAGEDAGAWRTWTPTWTGFSANPTVTARYKQVDKLVICKITVQSNGTSNGTGLTMSLPVTGRESVVGAALGIGTDNGSTLATPVRIDLSTTTATFYATPAGGAWTNSGAKAVFFGNLVYESA